MLKIIFFILLFSYSFTQNAFAMFCPSNFSNIELGDSQQHVLEICGNPNAQSTHIKPIYLSQEWLYYVKLNPTSPTTGKLSIILNNDRVVNINITDNSRCQNLPMGNALQLLTPPCNPANQEQRSVSNTMACGPIISIGDTMQQVEMACGKPVFVNHSQQPDAQITVTEYNYNGPPPTTLLFENGILKERIQQ